MSSSGPVMTARSASEPPGTPNCATPPLTPAPRLARRAGPGRMGRGPERPLDPRHRPGPAGDTLRVRPRQLRGKPRLQLRLRALLPRGQDVRGYGLARPGTPAAGDGRRRGVVASAHRRRVAY